MQSYDAINPHELNDEETLFLSTLTPQEYALHVLAIEKLGSSYFVWKSHAFMEWKNKK